MDCPRCKLPLGKEAYEGYEVEICAGCWGVWLDPGELEKIVLARRYSFSEEEKKSALDPKHRSPTTPVACPKCGVRMERLYIDPTLGLVIDRCPRHGTWLDAGEIKRVQALAESAKDRGRTLVDALRGKSAK